MKKTNYRKAIVVGFLVVYVMSMFFSTYMVKENFAVKYRDYVENVGTKIQTELDNISVAEREELDSIDFKSLVLYLMTSELNPNKGYYGGNGDNEKYQQLSCAVYNRETGEKLAQSGVLVTDGLFYNPQSEMICAAYNIEEILAEEQLRQVVEYRVSMDNAYANGTYPKYFYNMLVDLETNELIQIDFIEMIWDATLDGGNFDLFESQVKDIELLLRWCNSDVNIKDREITTINYNRAAYDFPVIVPYLHRGFEAWEKWQNDTFLQGFPERFGRNKTLKTDGFLGDTREEQEYELHFMDDTYFCLVVRSTSNSWLAAIDYMKFVYLSGFVIVLACMLKVLYTTEKTYRERAKLEETRRDFTNAIAHELKTPLGIIRGFAENLQENTNEAKREYYLNQIVGQTERMDEMVKEMIYISKLDSEKLVLNKEVVSVKALIAEALEALNVYIEEKGLQVQYKGLPDREMEGDPQYLKKAVWNIISNAVEYNRQGGKITIIFEEKLVRVQNTGNPIPDEDLPHVFDMFYTGNKSRTSGEKHLGLGLYLTKKIFDLHGIHVSIGNIEEGVEVVIKK